MAAIDVIGVIALAVLFMLVLGIAVGTMFDRQGK